MSLWHGDNLIQRVRDYLLDQDRCGWCHVPFTCIFLACLTVFLVCTYQVGWVYTVERDVKLSEPFLSCTPGYPDKPCSTRYMAILPDGRRERFDPYMFEFASGAVGRDLKVKKAKYSFTYYLDGVEQTWPYLPKLLLAWVVSLTGILLWFRLAGPTHFGRFMWRERD